MDNVLKVDFRTKTPPQASPSKLPLEEKIQELYFRQLTLANRGISNDKLILAVKSLSVVAKNTKLSFKIEQLKDKVRANNPELWDSLDQR